MQLIANGVDRVAKQAVEHDDNFYIATVFNKSLGERKRVTPDAPISVFSLGALKVNDYAHQFISLRGSLLFNRK
ncbi:hypothetical protein D3C80_2203070 [compost metagenome]